MSALLFGIERRGGMWLLTTNVTERHIQS